MCDARGGNESDAADGVSWAGGHGDGLGDARKDLWKGDCVVQVEKWKKMRGRVKVFVKPVLIVFVIILLGMSAILRANFSYVDDLARTVEGYKGWGNFSRYLSNALAVVLFGNGALTDISPWPQIVAAFIMAVAGVSLLYIIYGRKLYMVGKSFGGGSFLWW